MISRRATEAFRSGCAVGAAACLLALASCTDRSEDEAALPRTQDAPTAERGDEPSPQDPLPPPTQAPEDEAPDGRADIPEIGSDDSDRFDPDDPERVLEGTVLSVVYLPPWADDEPLIIFAAHSDGWVLWSDDTYEGGPPYHAGRVDQAALAEALAALDELSPSEGDRTEYSAPNTGMMEIRASFPDGEALELRSGHELVEQNPVLVAREYGVEPLLGQNRDDVLAGESEPYRAFRARWSDIRRVIRGLRPEG